MRALCIGRHPFLSAHLGRFFGRLGLETTCVTGFDAALRSAVRHPPDVALCEVDLLGARPLERWERESRLARVPILAVSLTRRPEEALVPVSEGVAGFLYLPTLRAEDARRILGVARPPAGFNFPSMLDRSVSSYAPPTP